MPDSRRKTRNEHSSGGAVIDLRDGVPFVAMIATRGRSRRGLPKGAVSPGETSEQAALREVQEETGRDAEVIVIPETLEYFFPAGTTLIKKIAAFNLTRSTA